jgi:uncharacterized membrane protein
MKKPSSKLGLTLSGLYLVFTIYMVISALACSGMFCGLIIVYPTLPWVYFWATLTGRFGHVPAFVGYFLMIVSILLNILILYLLGKAIERAFTHKAPR